MLWNGFVSLSLALAPLQEARTLSAAAGREDLALLREAVLTVHAGLGRYAPEAEFLEACAELEQALGNGVSDLELYREVSLLLAGLRCGHTRVDGPGWLDEYRASTPSLLPFHFVLLDGRMFVDVPVGDTKLPRGTEILRIDGTEVATRIEQIGATVPVDGWTDAIRPSRLQSAYEFQESGLDHYLPLFDRFRSRFELEVRLPGSEAAQTLGVDAVTLDDWRAAVPGTGWTDFADEVSWRLLDDTDERTALLRVGTFVNYRRPVDPEATFTRIFREIAETECEHLVLDLRDCGGGSSDVGWTLARFLIDEPLTVGGPRRVKNIRFGELVEHLSTWDKSAFNQPRENFREREDGWFEILGETSVQLTPHPARFEGRITVLSGPFNASGATMLLAKLQESGSVELVGEETGGSAEGPSAGLLFTLTLPNSGIRVNLPVIREASGVREFRAGHGVTPERLVRPTLADFLDGRDVVLERALGARSELEDLREAAAKKETQPRDGTDWPCWRGPDRNGISPWSGWSSQGVEEPLWVAQVGRGYSSPSIANGRLFTRGFVEAQGADGAEDVEGVDVTLCLDARTGAKLWSHAVDAKLWDNMHGGGTLSTPVVDMRDPNDPGQTGDVVYSLSRMGPLTAFAAEDGEVLWQRSLTEEFAIEKGFFGISSSPLVLPDKLVVNVGKTVALDKRSGKTLWETRDYGYSYATPERFELDGEELLAIFNAEGLVILEPEGGEELAKHEWTSGYNVNSASPIVIDNRIFISTGYDEKGCTMLELTPDGLETVWASKRMSNKMNGCVLVGEHLYGFDGGVLRCLDLDGQVKWSERGLGKGTLIASDGRLIVLAEEGELLIAPVSERGFEATQRIPVFEKSVCWTTPVLAGGLLYLRNAEGTLVCRDHRAKQQ